VTGTAQPWQVSRADNGGGWKPASPLVCDHDRLHKTNQPRLGRSNRYQAKGEGARAAKRVATLGHQISQPPQRLAAAAGGSGECGTGCPPTHWGHARGHRPLRGLKMGRAVTEPLAACRGGDAVEDSWTRLTPHHRGGPEGAPQCRDPLANHTGGAGSPAKTGSLGARLSLRVGWRRVGHLTPWPPDRWVTPRGFQASGVERRV